MALMDRDSKPPVIRYFPETQLPEGMEERFDVLFRTKEKWTAQEITPYIKYVFFIIIQDQANVKPNCQRIE